MRLLCLFNRYLFPVLEASLALRVAICLVHHLPPRAQHRGCAKYNGRSKRCVHPGTTRMRCPLRRTRLAGVHPLREPRWRGPAGRGGGGGGVGEAGGWAPSSRDASARRPKEPALLSSLAHGPRKACVGHQVRSGDCELFGLPFTSLKLG